MAFIRKSNLNALKESLEDSQAEIERLKRDVERLNSFSGSQRTQISNLNDENRRKTEEIERLRVLERALHELENVRAQEKKVKESVAKLIVTEDTLISLISEAKKVLAEIINLLRFVLEPHPRLKDDLGRYLYENRAKSVGGIERIESELINSSIRKLRANLNYEYRLGYDDARNEYRLFISIVGSFMILYDSVQSLSLLVAEERRHETAEERLDNFVLRYMKDIYVNIHKAVQSSMAKESGVIGGPIVELTEEEIKAYSKSGKEEVIIYRLNERIQRIMQEILSMLEDLRYCIATYGDYLKRPFPEFARIYPKLLEQMKILFRIFVGHINKNAKLAEYLIAINDKKIANAQNEFNSFLRHWADNFDLSVRQMEFDFGRR